VRQRRTITYEKFAAAKNFFDGLSMEKRAMSRGIAPISASNAHGFREMGGSVFLTGQRGLGEDEVCVTPNNAA
jgi:hypothetical protein